MTSTPMRPSTTAPIRLAVMRSPSTGSASRSAHAGAVNSSANTVASGRSRRLFAQRYCAPRWTVLRKTCSGRCRLKTVDRRSARTAARVAITTKPRPARAARISMTLNVSASTRTETAIAENASNAPLIQRTTRTRCLCATIGASPLKNELRARSMTRSLRVKLVLRPGLLKGGEFRACRIDRDDFGKPSERHLQTPRVVDLRHQADIGQRDLAAEGIGRRADHGFHRGEALENPVVIPGVDLGLVLTKLVLEVAQRSHIVERVDVAGDHLGERAHLRPLDGVARQQRRLGMDFVEIFDDRERLNEHVAGIELQGRQAHLRIDRAIFRFLVEAALLLQVDRNHLAAQALEVERDAHPIGRRRAKIGIKLHVSSLAGRSSGVL